MFFSAFIAFVLYFPTWTPQANGYQAAYSVGGENCDSSAGGTSPACNIKAGPGGPP